MMYGSLDIESNRQNFLSFWTIFCLTLTTQKTKFKKMKKIPRNIIILQMCTINDNHMMYVPKIWSTTDRNFCHLGPFFALLPP